LVAKDGGMDLPSSTPINVFEMQKGQVGIGYIQFNVKLELEDEYFGDKIGDVDYDAKGLIISFPASVETPIGKMFEYSYTIGKVDSKLKDNTFTDGSKTYNNTYEKSGFYVGWRPVFSASLYEDDNFKLQSATALHFVAYSISGDFTIHHDGSGLSNYGYDETNTGIGFKPSTVLSGTWFPINNLGISAFGGLSTFAALDYNSYSSKSNSFEDDVELATYVSSIDPIYGADIIFKGIFAQSDSFNLSAVFTNKNDESNMETIVRYVFNF
jgi:hypothetical protein